MQVLVLETHDLVERVLSYWLAPLDLDEAAHLCVSLDAEWNMSRRIGVSTIQLASHLDRDQIYIIPVSPYIFTCISILFLSPTSSTSSTTYLFHFFGC